MLASGTTSASMQTITLGGSILGVYLLFAFVYNLSFSMRPSWHLLNQTLKGLAERVAALEADRIQPPAALVQGIVDAETDLVGPIEGRRWYLGTRSCPLFIGTSRVQALWRRAHDLDIEYWKVAPAALVQQRLYGLRDALAAGTDTESRGAVRRIDDYKRRRAPAGEARPMLLDTMRIYYDKRDTVYDSLTNQQTTGVGLTILGIAAIAIVAFAFHREPLLLFGALGGFLSRTARLLRRRPGPQHFGVSAVLFMLAPVVGALSGFAGVALAQGLTHLKVLNTDTFGTVWNQPRSTTALTLTFAFGFVERLIDNAANLAAGTLKSGGTGATTGTTSSNPLPDEDHPDPGSDDQKTEKRAPAKKTAKKATAPRRS